MSTQPKPYLLPEEYLEIERKADFKSEYFAGEMFAMSGARRAHNLITVNAVASLHGQLRGRSCEAYSNDMRVLVSPTGLYTYPDIVVVSGDPKFKDENRDTLLNPTLVVEVLSESTKLYDRLGKFAHYESIPSVVQYLLISSMELSVVLFTRQADGSWNRNAKYKLEDSLSLQAIDCHLKLADVYEKVEFFQTPPGMRPAQS